MERYDPQCHGKVKYPTKAAALHRIDCQMARRGAKQHNCWGKRKMSAYHCPRCNEWHVGGSVPKAKELRTRSVEWDEGLLDVLPISLLAKLGGGMR